MKKKLIVWLGMLASGIVLPLTAGAQIPPRTGSLYQITSGTYTMVGGIWGTLTQDLPSTDQAIVMLTTDPQSGRAELRVLAQDQQTVSLTLTNGLMSGTVIRFQHQTQHPYAGIQVSGTADYTVTNLAGALRIDGGIEFPPLCCDIPFFFGHTNVAAIAMPLLTIRVSEVELCWSSDSNRTYQVQYRSDLTTDLWTDLGLPIVGSGPTSCMFDRVSPGQSQRIYRVVALP
jgi:hypothetical protein